MLPPEEKEQTKTFKDYAPGFLRQTLTQHPFQIKKTLTGNGLEFSYNLLVEARKPKNKVHPFVKICQEQNIEHRTTLVKHPWTNGMVESNEQKN